MVKSLRDWVSLYYDGKISSREEFVEMADELILYGSGLQVPLGIEIYRRELEESPPLDILLASAERRTEGIQNWSVECYKEVLKQSKELDGPTVDRMRQGLNSLRDQGRKDDIQSKFYYEEIDMCEEWINRKLNPNYDATHSPDWIKRFEHGQVETKEELRFTAQEMVRKGDFNEALSIYLTQLEEEMPLDLLLESAEQGMDIYSGFSIPRYGAVIAAMSPDDTITARRILTGLELLTQKLSAFGKLDVKDPDTIGVEFCKSSLSDQAFRNLNRPVLMHRYGFLRTREEFEKLAEYHLSNLEFESSMSIYEKFVGRLPSESVLLESAEMGESCGDSAFSNKCYKQILQIRGIAGEPVDRVKRRKMALDVDRILEMRRRNLFPEESAPIIQEEHSPYERVKFETYAADIVKTDGESVNNTAQSIELADQKCSEERPSFWGWVSSIFTPTIPKKQSIIAKRRSL